MQNVKDEEFLINFGKNLADIRKKEDYSRKTVFSEWTIS